MKQIWAPWRIEYIQMEKEERCILCQKPKLNKYSPNYILYRGDNNFVIMNKYPYNPGHLMVATYRHIASLEDLTQAELHEHFEIVSRCVSLLKEVFKPQGFNIGINTGAVAGAGITDHFHTHIVPRWTGDTNFMPVVAETRVVSAALDEIYGKLKGKLK